MEDRNSKINVYFDYNVFENISKTGYECLDKINVFCSVAHVEEYYKALFNCWKNSEHIVENVEMCNRTRNIIELLSQGFILNPSNDKNAVIYAKEEKFDDCLRRVAFYDTRSLVNKNAQKNYEIFVDSVKGLQKQDKSVLNNSNLSYEEIWNRPEVISRLNYRNNVIAEASNLPILTDSEILSIVKQYRYLNIDEMNLFLSYISIPHISFKIEKECLKKNTYSFHELEVVIELLNNILCECGYHKDTSKRNYNSGAIHGVSHMIYASYCDYFVTNDEPLQKRAQAIYWFSDISTKVISWGEFRDRYLK